MVSSKVRKMADGFKLLRQAKIERSYDFAKHDNFPHLNWRDHEDSTCVSNRGDRW